VVVVVVMNDIDAATVKKGKLEIKRPDFELLKTSFKFFFSDKKQWERKAEIGR